MATIIDLLEGSMYGLDLLKLHSVTTKLLSRIDNMEKVSRLKLQYEWSRIKNLTKASYFRLTVLKSQESPFRRRKNALFMQKEGYVYF